jgi:hypothetical protein
MKAAGLTRVRSDVYQAFSLRGFPERADERIRTADPFITSEVLYQLSYVGKAHIVARGGPAQTPTVSGSAGALWPAVTLVPTAAGSSSAPHSATRRARASSRASRIAGTSAIAVAAIAHQ